MRRRLVQHGDEGFTLIEVLVVIVILPLVVGAIAAGMMSLFTNSGTTQTRLNDSHDAQITSTYFVRDVQSAQYVSTSTTPLCGTAAQLLGVSWSSLTSGGTVITNAATYSVDPSADTLVRTFCANGSTSTVVLAHNAFAASPAPTIGACPGVGIIGVDATSCALTGPVAHAAVTITCTDGTITCANAGSLATTPQTSGAVGINLVRLDVLEQSGFIYNLTASPRGWTTVAAKLPGPGSAGSPALALIGTNPGGTFQGSGSCTLNVNGVAAINTATTGAVTENKNDFSATGGVISQTTSPITGPGAPTAIVGPPLSDPYAALVPPTGPSAPAASPPVTVVNGTFSPNGVLNGIYILNNGLSLSGNATITTGPDGVLLYVTNGSVNLTGGTSVDLAGPVAGYAPIVIWIDKNDTGGSVSLGGTSNVTTVNGTIYAPNGTVNLTGGGGSGGVSAGAIVANQLNCQGGGNGVGFSAGPPATNTVLTSSPNPSADGQSVTLTAQVNAIGSIVSTGQVLFVVKNKNGSQTVDCATAATVSATGGAMCVTGNLSAASGPYTITAYYQGNAAFSASTSAPLTQNVLVPTNTTLTVSPSSSPVPAGTVVTYTATVTAPTANPPATPTGTVTFAGVTCSGGNSQALDPTGRATCQSALHVAGSPYNVTATFAQNSSYFGSSAGPVTTTVNATPTTMAVTSSKNPSTTKDSVTFTAAVTPVPTDGTITWTITAPGATIVCPPGAPTASGTATCTVPANTFNAGPATVAATYVSGPTKDYSGSTGSLIQQVNGTGNSGTTTGASLSKSGNTVTDSVTMTKNGVGGPMPGGAVFFYLCATSGTSCTMAMSPSNFVQSLPLSNIGPTDYIFTTGGLTSGDYCLAAYYSGDSHYAPSSDTTGQCFTAP